MYEESRPAVAENCTSGSPRFYQPRDANPAVLAMHWHLAGEREQAALASLAAAEQAEQMHAPAATRCPRPSGSLRLGPDSGIDPATLRSSGTDSSAARRTLQRRHGDFAAGCDPRPPRTNRRGRGGTGSQIRRCGDSYARYRWEAEDGHGSRAAYEEAVRVSAEQRACRRTSHGPLRLRLAPRGNVPL